MQKITLIITGSIAAYKSLELIRLLRKQNIQVRCVMTKEAKEFITPMSVASISEQPVYDDFFSLKDEVEMGHIQLSRDADALLIAPASANILAKMAQGICDDLATTLLLATDKPVYAAPAMNVRMWEHKATQRNITQLKQDGIHIIGPEEGDMACGEYGLGRMIEPEDILASLL